MNNIDHHDDELKYRPFSRLSRHKKKTQLPQVAVKDISARLHVGQMQR